MLRNSDELIPKIYLKGSCYKLCLILVELFDGAVPYYSTIDGHWITKIDGNYFDIMGQISQRFVDNKKYECDLEPRVYQSANIHTYSNQLGCPYNKYINTSSECS